MMLTYTPFGYIKWPTSHTSTQSISQKGVFCKSKALFSCIDLKQKEENSKNLSKFKRQIRY